MLFLNLLFYLISNGIILLFVGKKFNWKVGMTRKKKMVIDILFKLILTGTIFLGVSYFTFFQMTLMTFIVLIIYLNLCKEGGTRKNLLDNFGFMYNKLCYIIYKANCHETTSTLTLLLPWLRG